MTTRLTFASVRKELAAIGVTIRANEFNEYRIAMKGDHGDGILIDRGHTRESQIGALEDCLSEGKALAEWMERNARPAAPAKPVQAVQPVTYRLGSNEAVYAPGIVAWAISGYWNKPDRKVLENIICGWKIPVDAARKLLSKSAAYRIEGETVVFEA